MHSQFAKRGFFCLAVFLFITTAFAQRVPGSIKGILLDSSKQEKIDGATVSVIEQKDSTHRYFTLSGSQGLFEIHNIPEGDYILTISFQGLERISKPFSLNSKHLSIDFGTLKMQIHYKEMEAVVIKEMTQVKINKDTILYNADAFKTKENASVEDLLKKLPGVKVDKEGAVKAQGEAVQKIFIDGKEFFNNDTKMATQNLRADMIDQVQVYDDMSETAKFNHIDDGSRTKAINLKLKKDRRSGLFGKLSAGYGTKERYDGGFNINYFRGASQLSLTGRANNTNAWAQPNSSLNNTNTISRGITPLRTGLGSSSLLGINYRDAWSQYVDINAGYIFDHSDFLNKRSAYKRYFLNDSTILSNRESNFRTKNDNHRFYLNLVYTIDSFNSVLYAATANVQNANVDAIDSLINVTDINGSQHLSGTTRTGNLYDSKTVIATSNVLWRRKFLKPRRTLAIGLSTIFTRTARDEYTLFSSRFYNQDRLIYLQRNTDYYLVNKLGGANNNFSLSYTEPLGASTILELNYIHSNHDQKADRNTFLHNQMTDLYDQPFDSLVTRFNNSNRYNRFGANFQRTGKKYTYQFGMALQKTAMHTGYQNKDSKFVQQTVNFFPIAVFTYQLAKRKSLRLNYKGRTRQPGITQLQNVVDLSGYPFIRKGNPSLRQEFTHNLMASYNSINPGNFKNFFAFITFSTTHNKIANSIEQNAGEQVSMPVNLNGAYNASGNFTYSLPVKGWESTTLSFDTRINYDRDLILINHTKNFTHNILVEEEISLEYFADALEMSLNTRVGYNSYRYTIQPLLNYSFFAQDYSAQLRYTFPKNWILSSSIMYTGITKKNENVDQDYILWNASITKQLFKNKRGEFRLSVDDLLNQRRNTSVIAADNFVEFSENNTLRRFALLTFVYNINTLIRKR